MLVFLAKESMLLSIHELEKQKFKKFADKVRLILYEHFILFYFILFCFISDYKESLSSLTFVITSPRYTTIAI